MEKLEIQIIYNQYKLLEKLPVFFRTANGEKPTKKELSDLLTLIKQG